LGAIATENPHQRIAAIVIGFRKMFSVVDARALSRAAASDIPEWYITKSGQEPKIDE
jgi:hypothetical protein